MNAFDEKFDKLPEQLRQRLLDNPETALSSEDIVALTQVGITVMSAYWVDSESPGEFEPTQRFIAYLKGRRYRDHSEAHYPYGTTGQTPSPVSDTGAKPEVIAENDRLHREVMEARKGYQLGFTQERQ